MSKRVEIWRGEPYPLGATLTEEGVNFALYSEDATAVELCLFDSPESDASELRIPVTEQTDQTWHVFLPDIGPGQLYCYRVQGIYEPAHGLRFNNTKLLLDPYAQAIAGQVNWGEEVFAYTLGHPAGDLAIDYRDDAFCVSKCVVVDPDFDWVGDVAPPTPLHASVIYELHVKGFSMLNPAVPPPLRGTYAGLGCEPSIDYLKSLGVTAVELLPVHQHIDDMYLVRSGKTNYWGYNSIGFFAPECSYSSSGVTGGQVTEFKQMVKNLHRAGIEVILDVVYNHSAEGDHLGPTFCFKGIENVHYYRLAPWDPRFYMDYTGCGNTLDATKRRVLQMITDSLRYWITEMHVDGFRFDLAASLARGESGVSKFAAFFEILHQDPVISRVKLIAEPWDVGEGGYQVGNFPVLWAEWNGRYRDSVRRFWKGDTGLVGEIAYRLSGSSDLYQSTGKRPYASINFVTSHDGFTLNDLVSYNEKHNEANGEGNRDGDDNNNSWNCGVEGPTADEGINALRDRQRRNFLATLLLSQGVPMLCAGDEFCRTQGGNNNAYCQDNPVSWLSWEHDARAKSLLDFTRALVAQRRAHPIFRRPKFFQGRPIRGATIKDIMWFNSSGAEMSDAEWSSWFIRCLGMLLGGVTIDVRDRRGRPIRDDTFLVLLNAHYEPVPFVLPGLREAEWELMMDTAREPSFVAVGETYGSAACYDLRDRSTALLRLKAGFEPDAAANPAWRTA
jgi:glycogen operon protein